MSEITIHTGGGLGNLLFMIGLVYSLHKKYNIDYKIYLNNKMSSSTKRKTPNQYHMLKNFNISNEECIFNKYIVYREKNFWYEPINIDINKKYNFIGYYQSLKYFDKYFDDFKNMLNNPYEKVVENYFYELKKIYNKEVVSVHFRRTDYLNLPDFHYNLNKSYYLKALELFNNDYLYVFFSDDIEWVKQQNDFDFIKDKIYFENPDEELTLWTMSKCDHNIIANSTFSLWASYLNDNINKKVIVPDHWFGLKGPKIRMEDLFPEKYIIINC